MATNIENQIAAARKAGHSDQDIFKAISQSPKYSTGFEKARTAGYSNAQIAKDLGLNLSKNSYVAPDLNEQRKENMRKAAKDAGPTKAWESLLLGASDLGAGVMQGVHYVGDKAAERSNTLLGTNFDTKDYEKFTKQRKGVSDFHDLQRKENNQGFDGLRLVGQVASTAPMAAAARGYQGAQILSAAGARVAAQNALLGGALGGASFADDSKQRMGNIALGAIGGAAGGAIGEKVGQGVSKVARGAKNQLGKLSTEQTNRILQSIDDKLDDALRSQGMKLSDLGDDVANGLRAEAKKALQSGKSLSAEAVARKAVLDRFGIKGTRGQITGDPRLWNKEAELAKVSGAGDKLQQKFVSDNKRLAELLDETIAGTKGNAVDQYGASRGAIDSLLSQNDQNKAFVREAYNAAHNAAGNDVKLNAQGFANDAFTSLDKNYAASSLPANIQKILKDVNDHPDMFTLGKSEELIKILNREYKSSLQNGQPTSATHAIGLVREALNSRQDEALQSLLAAGGNDAAQAYQFAREAHKASASLRDKMPLLQDALKGVEPDKLFQKHILNGNVAELGETVNVLKNTNPQAVADIRQQVLQHISGKSINQNGQFSPAGMKRALDALGDRKLNLLFDPADVSKIKDIARAGEYLVTQPAHAYVNNSNSASGLMNYFGSIVKGAGDLGMRVPWLNSFVVEPVAKAGNHIGAVRALNGGSIAGKSTPAPPNSGALYDRLVKAGVIAGANASNK